MKKVTIIIVSILVFALTLKVNIVYADNNSDSENVDNQSINYCDSDRSGSSGSSGGGYGSLDEDWYNIGTSLPHSVDYSESDLLKYLKPGDLVYEAAGGSGITGHSAIVEGVFYDSTYEQYYVRLLEAVSDGVTRGLMTPTRFEEKEVSIYRLNYASLSQINEAISFFISQLGKPYAISLTKNASSSNPNWYCSELVWASYYWQEIYLDEQDSSPVLPAEIRDYEDATLIMDYRYSTTINNINSATHTLSCNNNQFTEAHNYITVSNCLKQCSVCDYEVETHNYLYQWKSYTQHKTRCMCGILKLDPHVVSSNAFSNGQQYATCLLCGGLASIGIVYSNGASQPLATTVNGSFILSNGVIVLEDEDIDAYLEGTLVFNYSNSNILNSKTNIPQYLKKKEEYLYS